MSSPKVKRAIAAFEKAVTDRALYTARVPYDTTNFLAIEHNYVKARAKLERLMENL